MIYEIGISYPENELDQQVKLDLSKYNYLNLNRLMFFDQYGNRIYHWIEDYDNQIVWIKVNVLNNNTKIFLTDEQGKDLSDGDNTFEFFDDFLGDTIDTNKWKTSVYGTPDITVQNSVITIQPQVNVVQNGMIYTIPTFTNNFIYNALINISLNGSETLSYTQSGIGVDPQWEGGYASNYWYQELTNGYIWNIVPQPISASLAGRTSTTTWATKLASVTTPDVYGKFVHLTHLFTNSGSSDMTYHLLHTEFTNAININGEKSIFFSQGNYSSGYGAILSIDYVFVHKYLPSDPKILYINPKGKTYHNNTAFNKENNILNYNNDQYIETPIYENIITPSSLSVISPFYENIMYYRYSDVQPDITYSGMIYNNELNRDIKYWNQSNITNSGWNNISPSQYITQTSETEFKHKYIQFKIKVK